MKQGKIYNRIIMLLLMIAVVFYVGYSLMHAVYEPMNTVLAVEYEAGAGCRSSGYVVRSEQVLNSQYDITVLSRREGEKVGMGQTVATGYLTPDAQERQSQMAQLEAQLQQLKYAYSYNVDLGDNAALDAEIVTELITCSQHVARRDLNSVADMGPKLKGLLLRRSTDEEDLASIQQEIQRLQGELNQLQTSAGADTMAISAPTPGYFSGTVDGYERKLTPERLTSLSAAELESMEPSAVSQRACGRIIRGNDWYFACVVDSEYLAEVQTGDQVDVSFSNDFYRTLSMTIFRMGEDEDGRRLLILKSGEYIQDVTLLRQQTVNIVFNSYYGLRVPKNALRMDEGGQPGVFVLESAMERWKPVTILYDNGESYIVELDKSDTDNLWPGDEIIVDAQDMFDGKVVEPT